MQLLRVVSHRRRPNSSMGRHNLIVAVFYLMTPVKMDVQTQQADCSFQLSGAGFFTPTQPAQKELRKHFFEHDEEPSPTTH